MFKESDSLEALSDQKMGILIVESDLREHQKEIGKILKRKTIDYVTVAGVEYLVELKNDATKLVPTEWVIHPGSVECQTNWNRSRFLVPDMSRDFIPPRSSRWSPNENRGKSYLLSNVTELIRTS